MDCAAKKFSFLLTDVFNDNQLFLVFEFENAGCALESFKVIKIFTSQSFKC